MGLRAQGAIELKSASTAGTLLGQGATEYLVLLAVVLIVALVSVALLGFFPGMASDAQQTQSKAYWSGASPVAITEWAAMAYSVSSNPTYTLPYLRLRNNGMYPIRITKMIGDGGQYINQFYNGNTGELGCPSGGVCNMSDHYYLAPGEELYFADTNNGGKTHYNVPGQRYIGYRTAGGASGGYNLYSVASVCGISPPYGSAVVKNFGFEYIEYIDNQQITKRQIGKDLIIKCSQPPA